MNQTEQYHRRGLPWGLPFAHHICMRVHDWEGLFAMRGSKKDQQLKIIGTYFINKVQQGETFNHTHSLDKLMLHFLCHQLDGYRFCMWGVDREKGGRKEENKRNTNMKKRHFLGGSQTELVAKVLCDLFHIPRLARVSCANSNSRVGEVWLSRCYFPPCPVHPPPTPTPLTGWITSGGPKQREIHKNIIRQLWATV